MKQFRFGIKLRYLLLILVVLALLGNRGFRSLVTNYREYRTLKARKAALETQRKDLAGQLGAVNESPAVEQAARKELGLIRPGETEYRFPPPKESDK